MKRRHQRRTTLVALAGLTFASGLLSLTPAAPATAVEKIAGVGLVNTGGPRLNARSEPSAGSFRTGSIASGTYISIVCQVVGQHVDGTVKDTRVWNGLPNGSYISDAFIARRWYKIPVCSSAAPAVNGAWSAPLRAGLVSGFRTSSRPTHDGVDLAVARNTPIKSVAAGTVIRVVCNASTNNCNVDGSRMISGCGWYVEVQHARNVVTRYCHMVQRPSVQVGQSVARGQTLGYVGTSGGSSGPHLHFEVHVNAPPATRSNAVDPVGFMRSRGVYLG